MILEAIHNGMFGSNCYIAGDDGHGILIDAGVPVEYVLRHTDRLGITINYIVLTHGHVDHICHTDDFIERFKCPLLVHAEDSGALCDPLLNGSLLFGLDVKTKPADILLKHGDIIQTKSFKFEIIHTPGHTPGGICIRTNDFLFTGDTLFKLSVGRTDLGFGSHDQLQESIKTRLMTLDDTVVVYPGHGPSTSIGYERKHNPFIT